MTEVRPIIERNVAFKPGPVFFEEAGVTLFQFVIDSANTIGPRKATKADRAEYPMAWEMFNEGRLPQLDHDQNGSPGGSVPSIESVKRGPGRPPKPKE